MSGYIGNILVPQATQTRDSFIATAGQTSFPTSGYTPNFLDVYLNGIKLHSSDFTATNGSDVVLATGASVNDVIEVVAYNAFDVASGTFDDLTVNNNIAVSGTVDGRDIATDGTKLDGIESGATGDQTNAEIRAAVEAATDSNVFTDADHTKLNAIEASATADQTASEIRTLVESATDSNVFTDADHTKLNAIESGATADQTKSDIDALNINADTLDGQHGSYYTGYADTAVANIVDSAPGTLDTLNELAAALGDDPNFATTVTNSIATKLPLAGGTLTGNLDVGGTVTADGLGVVSSGTNSQSLAEFSSASGLRAKIASDGGDDGYMYLYDTNDANTVSFRTDGNHSFINGGGNFGIGTSSPSESLHTAGNIRLGDTSPAEIYTNSNELRLGVDRNNDNAASDITFYANNDEKVRIDSSGNVGIGTSSPSGELEVKSTGDADLYIRSGDSNAGSIYFASASDSQEAAIRYFNSNNSLRFYGHDMAEAMRIDASGNVLVGMTSNGITSTGIGLVRDGTSHMYSGGTHTLELGRGASDGDILKFNRSGSTVGSIQSRGGAVTTVILDPRTNGVGITGTANAILPTTNTGGITSTAVDLGASGYEYRNLHLSGTVNAEEADIDISTNARLTINDGIGEVGIGNVALQAQNSAGSALKPLGFRAEDIRFATGSSERMRIGSNGYLGIGTTGPQELLHVMSGSSAGIRVSGGANNNSKTEIGYDTSNGPYVKGGSSGITSLKFYVDNTSLALTLASNRNATFAQSVTATTFHGDGSNLTGVGGSTAFGAVGTYTAAYTDSGSSASDNSGGATIAGSSLRKNNGSGSLNNDFKDTTGVSGTTSAGLSGTWRYMSRAKKQANEASYAVPAALFVRIS